MGIVYKKKGDREKALPYLKLARDCYDETYRSYFDELICMREVSSRAVRKFGIVEIEDIDGKLCFLINSNTAKTSNQIIVQQLTSSHVVHMNII